MNIFVGNLSYEMTEADLRALFEEHGTVESAKIITDRQTGRAKGFGFVEMPDEAAAQGAIENLNKTEQMGREIIVNEARPRREGPKHKNKY